MSAIKKVQKEDIIDSAFNLLRNGGIEQVSVRNIAKLLKCSTKPIYFQFENMEKLKFKLKELAEKKYIDITDNYKSSYGNLYISHGMAYIAFAREEKYLFKYLYLNGRVDKTKLQIDDANYNDIIAAIKNVYGIKEEVAKALHFDMAIYSYGIAVMVNTGFIELTDKEIAERLTIQGQSLRKYYLEKKEDIND